MRTSTALALKKVGNDQAIGRSRGGLTTKIHAIVVPEARLQHDALGNPVALSLTPGQAHDSTQAVPLLDHVEPEALLADKGYDSDALVATLEERGIEPVIPSKANRKQPRKTDLLSTASATSSNASSARSNNIVRLQRATTSWRTRSLHRSCS